MERKQIESMDEWLYWKKGLVDAGFRFWQTPYGWDLPEGLIVGFMCAEDDKRFEIGHTIKRLRRTYEATSYERG